jgi:hypothetical protein
MERGDGDVVTGEAERDLVLLEKETLSIRSLHGLPSYLSVPDPFPFSIDSPDNEGSAFLGILPSTISTMYASVLLTTHSQALADCSWNLLESLTDIRIHMYPFHSGAPTLTHSSVQGSMPFISTYSFPYRVRRWQFPVPNSDFGFGYRISCLERKFPSLLGFSPNRKSRDYMRLGFTDALCT